MPSSDRTAIGRRSFLILSAGVLAAWATEARAMSPSPVRKIGWTPRLDGLSFSGRVLAQRTRQGIRLWDAPTGRILAEHKLSSLIAVGTLADGSLLAIEHPVSRATALRIPKTGEPVRYTVDGLIPTKFSRFFPVPGAPNRFWLLFPMGSMNALSLYELPTRSGPIACLANELGGDYPGDVSMLADGTLVSFAENASILVRPPSPTRGNSLKELRWDFPDGRLLAPGPSRDLLWAASVEGEVHLLRFQKGLSAHTVRSFKVPKRIFQLESSSGPGPGLLAVLQLENQDAEAARWTLLVLDERGRRRLSVEPKAIPVSTKSRGGPIVDNCCIRLTAEVVAMGGPERLLIWDLRSGKLVVDHTG